jgi:hypothetical protein
VRPVSPEQTEWGIELPEDAPASPANGEYREPMDEARKHGLAARQQQRLANATYTAIEVEALTRTATELGRRLGHKEAAEEITAALLARRSEITPNRPGWVYLTEAIGMVSKSPADPNE